jgi:hypothetical protein
MIPPRREIRLVFIWTKYIAGMKPLSCLTSYYFCCNKSIYACSKGKNSSRLAGMKCLYGNFSSRLGGIPASVVCFQIANRSLQSTVTALLDITNEWYTNIDIGKLNGIVSLDLKFDTVDHNALLDKIAICIDNHTCNWWLTLRVHCKFLGVESTQKVLFCNQKRSKTITE